MYNRVKRLVAIGGERMKKSLFIVLVIVAVAVGCALEKPEGAMTVSELLEDPVYDTEVTIYGEVSLLGQLNCPCFELTSGGQGVQVWYDLMVEDDGTERPAASIEGIDNGDSVVAVGELKTAGQHRSLNDFWAATITEMD
jgi:hypothetical protein